MPKPKHTAFTDLLKNTINPELFPSLEDITKFRRSTGEDRYFKYEGDKPDRMSKRRDQQFEAKLKIVKDFLVTPNKSDQTKQLQCQRTVSSLLDTQKERALEARERLAKQIVALQLGTADREKAIKEIQNKLLKGEKITVDESRIQSAMAKLQGRYLVKMLQSTEEYNKIARIMLTSEIVGQPPNENAVKEIKALLPVLRTQIHSDLSADLRKLYQENLNDLITIAQKRNAETKQPTSKKTPPEYMARLIARVELKKLNLSESTLESMEKEAQKDKSHAYSIAEAQLKDANMNLKKAKEDNDKQKIKKFEAQVKFYEKAVKNPNDTCGESVIFKLHEHYMHQQESITMLAHKYNQVIKENAQQILDVNPGDKSGMKDLLYRILSKDPQVFKDELNARILIYENRIKAYEHVLTFAGLKMTPALKADIQKKIIEDQKEIVLLNRKLRNVDDYIQSCAKGLTDYPDLTSNAFKAVQAERQKAQTAASTTAAPPTAQAPMLQAFPLERERTKTQTQQDVPESPKPKANEDKKSHRQAL